jgi:pilus assembly protein CpaB
MVGRVLLLIAAFVVAGLGALLVWLYASQADRRALAEADPVPALVVQAEEGVPAGTTLGVAIDSGLIAEEQVPGAAVPDTAIIDPSERLDDIALTALVDGEVVVSSRFGNPADLQQLIVPDGLTAVSFTFGDPNRVAGFVTPGSEVAVFATLEGEENEEVDPVTGESVVDSDTTFTRLLLGEALVVGVGGSTTITETTTTAEGTQQTTEVSAALITLALTQPQIERLVLAQSLGELYLGLLNDTSEINPSDGANLDNLFDEAAP